MSDIKSILSDRLTTEYYGTDRVNVNPALIALLMQFVQTLLGGCTPKSAHSFVQDHPSRAYYRVLWEAVQMTNDTNEAVKMANTVVNVGKKSTLEEYTQFMSN